ncbi:MAG: hypothetical protein JXA96_07970 [Sedimentisphaerales bacterium]|nr:hypothetical protein [Sedimentisphaerales bacterium]
MRPAEEINKLIKKLNIKASANLDKRVTESISSEHAEIQKARSDYQNSFMRRVIMKNIKTKLAVAASLIIVCAILLTVVFDKTEPEIKIQIPQELISMDVEELIKLHYEPENSAYDPNIIKAALQQSLDKSNPQQIIQIAKKIIPKSGMRMSGQLAAPPVHPIKHLGHTGTTFHDVLEKSDIFVHANLIDIEMNVDDIIQALIEKEEFMHFEDFFTRYRVSLKLHIIETLPKDVLKSGTIITIPAIIDEQKLNMLKRNSGYYFSITLDKDNELHFLRYFSGVYEVDFNDPVNIEFWRFLSDSQDVLHNGNIPTQETIDYWVSKMTGDASALAFEYMDVLPDELLPDILSESLMDIYTDYKNADWQNRYATRIFPYSTPTSRSEYSDIEELIENGQHEEAFSKAIEILAQPISEEKASDMRRDLNLRGELLIILGRSQGEDVLRVINEYTRPEYVEHYQELFEKFGESQRGDWTTSSFLQKGIMALARLGGKSSIPKLRQFYESGNIRIKIVAALALYYLGDTTGEQLIREFVEGTYPNDPEIAMRWGQDMSDGTVFQDIISSYLRNERTDALWLEKMSYYLDRADTDVDSDFFNDYKPEILRIAANQLDNRDRAVRGHAIAILSFATGKTFNFDPDKYHGKQDDIIQRWRDYLDQEYPLP